MLVIVVRFVVSFLEIDAFIVSSLTGCAETTPMPKEEINKQDIKNRLIVNTR
jgi:hypothetical protein